MYDMKALYEAHSVEEAVALRLEHPEAQIIAGGSDVLVQMRRASVPGRSSSPSTASTPCAASASTRTETSASAR